MSVDISEEKTALLRSIADSEGFENYTLDVQKGSMKGDGYLGVINTIQIKNSEKTLNLIIKSALTNDKLRETAPIQSFYDREIFIYTQYFPVLQQLQDEYQIEHRFKETAKCFGTLSTQKEESLILENLKEVGYQLWDRKIGMNSEHVALVFTAYGKFHGTSYAFKTLNPKKYDEITKGLDSVFQSEEDMEKFKQNMTSVFGNGFKAVAGNAKATQALTKFTEKIGEYFATTFKIIDRHSVVVHGDCWCNNIMFKYEDSEIPQIPTDMKLLDFQLAWTANPALDLAYFFCTSSSKEVISDVKKYLVIYYDSLCKTLREFGCNPEEIMTFSELESFWNDHVKYGIFMVMFIMNVLVGESDEAVDLGEVAESGVDLMQGLTTAGTKNIEKGLNRIAEVILALMDQGYL